MRRSTQPMRRMQISQTGSVPAPIRGWNARDSVAAMKQGDAYRLRNWFPTTSDVMFRKGHAAHATGLGAQAETIVSYRPPTGTHKMFAFAGTNAYNTTAAGAVGAAVLSTLTNARWEFVNTTTSGGNFILGVNGLDKPRLYDGTTWTALDGASTPALTGVTSTTLANICVFKGRMWYIQAGTMDAWYTDVGTFSGALTKFSLGSLFKNGGYLMSMGAWTIDGGTGIDDLAVFITSTGEVAVYQGTNPAFAESWALVGLFYLGAPIGRRCFQKYGGDLLILTVDGVVPASTALINERRSGSLGITDNISGAFNTAASLYSSTFGWQILQYPAANMLLVNIPVAVGMQEQYVMNTTTGAWCQFTEWPANCFSLHNEELYFGMNGEIRKAWTGTSDAGANIVADMIGAFDYLGNRDGLKQMKMLRPVIGWDSNPAEFLIGVDVDFVTTDPVGVVSFPASSAGVWDTGTWDNAIWGGDIAFNKNWYTVNGLGYAIAPHLKVSNSRANIRVAAFDYLYERGGVL